MLAEIGGTVLDGRGFSCLVTRFGCVLDRVQKQFLVIPVTPRVCLEASECRPVLLLSSHLDGLVEMSASCQSFRFTAPEVTPGNHHEDNFDPVPLSFRRSCHAIQEAER